MSNEKLEALMWYGYGRDELFARGVFFHGNGINRINVADRAAADDIAETHNAALEKAWDTAHALGVEEGKRAAYAIAAKLADELTAAKLELERLREAAPVDDGRRFEMFVCTRAGARVRSANYPGTYPASDVATILAADSLAHETCRGCYEARLVEPKHVHNWGYWVAGSSAYRKCKWDGCDVEQSPEWKDEP